MNPLFDLTFLTTLHSLVLTNRSSGSRDLTYWLDRKDMPHFKIAGNVKSWPFVAPPPADMISGQSALNWGLLNYPVI